MKKQLLSLILAAVLGLSLLPANTFAAVTLPRKLDAPTELEAIEHLSGTESAGMEYLMVSFSIPESVQALVQECYDSGMANGETFVIQVDWSINSDTDWRCSGLDTWKGANDSFMSEYGSNMSENDAISSTVKLEMFRANYDYPTLGGYREISYGADDHGHGYLNLAENSLSLRTRFKLSNNNTTIFSDWSPVVTIGTAIAAEVLRPWSNASAWADDELKKAAALGLIPDNLKNTDLTLPVTRAEFAAVSVKVYEALTGATASPASANPFTDTANTDVLKAYNLGITSGVSADKFNPDGLLSREQAATMLTRAYKRISMPDWTLATDSRFPLGYNMPAAFADDAKIAAYAKDSVYFMNANGIITGATATTFAPGNQATREQALIIAVRMVQNLGH